MGLFWVLFLMHFAGWLFAENENIPWCFVSRIPGIEFQNDPRSIAMDGSLPGVDFTHKIPTH
jgi:hypothetical protein